MEAQSLNTEENIRRSDLPESDGEGFVEWVEREYPDDRYGYVAYDEEREKIVVRSGEHPAFPRFVKDLRSKLQEYGFVIQKTREDKMTGTRPSEEGEEPDDEENDVVIVRKHEIIARPVKYVLADMYGLICNRHACRNILETQSDEYCDACQFMHDLNGE